MRITWSATAYKSAIIHGRQQQTAIPMTHATATQITTKNTSNAKKVIQSLQKHSHAWIIQKATNENLKLAISEEESENEPVKLRWIFSQTFTTSRYPIESNDPPNKRKHCICRFQMLSNTATINGKASELIIGVNQTRFIYVLYKSQVHQNVQWSRVYVSLSESKLSTKDVRFWSLYHFRPRLWLHLHLREAGRQRKQLPSSRSTRPEKSKNGSRLQNTIVQIE